VTFVVSGGRLEAIDRPHWRVYPEAVELAPRVFQSYAQIWRTQPQVRTVISFLGRNIAQLGIHLFRRQSDVDRLRLDGHPLAQLLDKPTPFTTRYRLVDALVQDICIYDNAYWLKVRDLGQPSALVRLDPRRTTPKGQNAFFASEYEFRGGTGIQHFPAEQVVHFRGFSPTDPRSGSSPIETLRTILAEEYQAAKYREQLWRNGARASGYLRRPVEAPEWSREAKDKFRLQWQNQYTGEGSLSGGTPLLEDGMEFVSASVTPEQAQYLEARKLTREEVAAAYHIPPPMVGILDNATYSNITEQHKIMYQDTLGPWLQMLCQEMELQLLSDFEDIDRVYIEFNLAEKLNGSFEQQAAQLQTSTGAPYMTRNEARARLNLPQIDGADELVVPLNVLIGGQASPTDSAPPATDQPPKALAGPHLKAQAEVASVNKAQATLSNYFARQGQVISSKVGAATGKPTLGQVYDQGRWIGELASEIFGLAVAIATAAAKATLKALGLDPDAYDEDRTLPYLQVHAQHAAEAIEAGTEERLKKALAEDDPGEAVASLFAWYATSRAEEVARTEATALSGFGTAEAAEKTGKQASKTWRTHSKNSRATHAALDGETVAIDALFSNGGRWPGDAELPPDERVGCQCSMDVSLAD
jgi:HK97 family phage portal protein